MKIFNCWMIICMFGLEKLHKVSAGSKPAQCIQFNKLDEDWVEFKTSQHSITVEDGNNQFDDIEIIEAHFFVCKNVENSDDAHLANRGLRELNVKKSSNNAVLFLRCIIEVLADDFLASIEVKVHTLRFVDCKMKKIPQDLIGNLRSEISLLSITHSFIESKTISTGAFPQNTELIGIHIEHTNIQKVEADAFLGLPQLMGLFLMDNEIRSIDKDAFRNLTNLFSLNIADNNLKMLSPGIFDSLTNLRDLNLKGNNFQCDCNLKWLQDWLWDKTFNNATHNDHKVFKNEPITCISSVRINLETFTFCTKNEIAPPRTKNKNQLSDCPLKELVALNLLRKNGDKSVDDKIQEYLDKLDMANLCDPESCPYIQPFGTEDLNTC